MFNLKTVFLLMVVGVVFFLVSCQNEQNPIEPFNNTNSQTFDKITIPFGAAIDSAAFFINVTTAENKEVTIHRVTNFWEEMSVTWNNFASGYDGQVEGSFVPGSMGWYSADITGLVTSWFDGTNPNYGLLLKETSPDTTQVYSSKESGDVPYLIIWWTYNGSGGYDSTGALADSYIQSDSGDVNFGDSMELLTGWQDTVEAQTLVAFEIEIEYMGCTRSKGYWKTHSVYGPAPYDSTWALLGEDSTFFLSNQSNYEVMWTPPSGGNAYYNLAHHYIATWLNLLNGADPSEVQEAFDDATDLFEMYTPEYIGSLKGNNPIRQEFLSLKNSLEMYNDGYIGPGKCEESSAYYPFKTK